jgi:DNA-binding transcriptional ArsR family regulator
MSHWYSIKSPDQLEAIASPRREEIIDTVAQIGPCTVSEIARAIGRSRNALYYSVKALRDCGLLIESHRPAARAKATAVYDVPARPMAVNFSVDTPERRTAVNRLAEARLKQAIKGFRYASAAKALQTEGPARNLLATRVKGWLSDSDLIKVNQLLEQVAEIISEPSSRIGRRAYDFTFALYPTSPKPKGERK